MEILKQLPVLFLSASCCNPLSIPLDDKLRVLIGKAFETLGFAVKIQTISLTEAKALLHSL
ncbi:MAG: hypothetical protein GY765_18255, partial [bacterium]|nr:hypothetical protein [bacterium]